MAAFWGTSDAAFFAASNLTAGTVYEVAVWARTAIGDSPTALSHHRTGGVQPQRPLLKSRPLNQTAVECSWTAGGATVQVRECDGGRDGSFQQL